MRSNFTTTEVGVATTFTFPDGSVGELMEPVVTHGDAAIKRTPTGYLIRAVNGPATVSFKRRKTQTGLT